MKKVEQPKRRKILKKLAYTAPLVIALGQLTKPTHLKADGSQPPGNPGDGGGFPSGF